MKETKETSETKEAKGIRNKKLLLNLKKLNWMSKKN